MKILSYLILLTPIAAISTFPLDHIEAVVTTNIILEFLYYNQTIPFLELPSYPAFESAKSPNNCHYC